jgi:hypothetical protein
MSVLRLSLMYLRFLPSQLWVVLAASLLLATGLLVRNTGMFFLGAVLLVFFPALFGGVAMRMASSGKWLGLRPGGYRRMLLGAALATVLLTIMHVVPVLATVQAGWITMPRDFPIELTTTVGVAAYITLTWSVIAGCWLLMFCLASVPLLALVVLIIPPLLTESGIVVAFVNELSPPFAVLPLLVGAGWLAFAAWYLRGRVLRSPAQLVQGLLHNRGSQRSTLDNGGEGRTSALRAYLLGATSSRDMLLGSSFALICVIPLALIAARRPEPRPLLGVVFSMLLAMGGASMALSVMRRARFLWLKAGVDRPALFAIVEQVTARAAAVFVLISTIALMLLTAFMQPESLAVMLLFSAVFAAFGFSMMYAALCFVRPWQPGYILPILLCASTWAYLVWRLLPTSDPTVTQFVAALLAMLALAAGLRLLARRLWRHLDWQLLRPFAVGTPDRGVHGA